MNFYWLIEKIIDGKIIYLSKEKYQITDDPYKAMRFIVEKDAHSYIEKESLSDQGYSVAEHGLKIDGKKCAACNGYGFGFRENLEKHACDVCEGDGVI